MRFVQVISLRNSWRSQNIQSKVEQSIVVKYKQEKKNRTSSHRNEMEISIT